MKNILILAGIVEIAVGLLHFFMPPFAYQSPGYSSLNRDELGFVTLIVYAVGILLIAFGSLTLALAKLAHNLPDVLYAYLRIKTILWSSRVLLEILYPINLPMFFIEPFTIVVLPGLVMELLLFIMALVLVRRIQQEVASHP